MHIKTVIFMEIGCTAPDSVFTSDYNDIPQEYREKIEVSKGINCGGSGVVSPWCAFPRECPFIEWDGSWDSED